jgi:hypothetical protein
MQIENDYPQTLGNTPAQLASTFGPLLGQLGPRSTDGNTQLTFSLPSSRSRLKPIPAVRVPDSRHKIYPAKVIAEDHELEGRGGPGYLKIRPPKLEARAEPLERRRGDLRCTPEISGDHQSRDMRKSIIKYLKVDGKTNQAGCYRVSRESHVSNGKSRLHLDSP